MKIQLHEILVRDLVKNYQNGGENDGVFVMMASSIFAQNIKENLSIKMKSGMK